jgi:hypothetical protein
MRSSTPDQQYVICRPCAGTEARLSQCAEDVARFDEARHFVSASEVQRFPEVGVKTRLSILLRTYKDDYHTDSFDTQRLIQRIEAGTEAIYFWGAATETDRLRELLAGDSTDHLPELELGTSTTISVEEEYGPGYGENCRNGSVDRTVGAKASFAKILHGYISDPGNTLYRRYHTIVGSARTRASTAEVRGGEAIHRISTRYLHGRMWGYSPFYVMQGGVLELTESIEINRDFEDVLNGLQNSPAWYILSSSEAAFTTALCEMNFGHRPDIRSEGPASPAEPWRYRLLMPADTSLLATNHVALRRTYEQSGMPLSTAIAKAEKTGTCCIAVQVDLTDSAALDIQAMLAKQGFVLSAVLPPKRTWMVEGGQRRDITCAATGIWVRMRPDLPVAPPYYANEKGYTEAEASVLGYLRSVLLQES